MPLCDHSASQTRNSPEHLRRQKPPKRLQRLQIRSICSSMTRTTRRLNIATNLYHRTRKNTELSLRRLITHGDTRPIQLSPRTRRRLVASREKIRKRILRILPLQPLCHRKAETPKTRKTDP
jgi:hypothetical protein